MSYLVAGRVPRRRLLRPLGSYGFLAGVGAAAPSGTYRTRRVWRPAGQALLTKEQLKETNVQLIEQGKQKVRDYYNYLKPAGNLSSSDLNLLIRYTTGPMRAAAVLANAARAGQRPTGIWTLVAQETGIADVEGWSGMNGLPGMSGLTGTCGLTDQIYLGSIFSEVSKVGKRISKVVSKVVKQVNKIVKKVAKNVQKVVKKTAKAVGKGVKEVGKGIGKGLKPIGKGMEKFGKSVERVVRNNKEWFIIGGAVLITFGAAAYFAPGALSAIGSGLVTAAKATGTGVIAAGKWIATGAVSLGKGLFSYGGKAFSYAFGADGKPMIDLVGKAAETFMPSAPAAVAAAPFYQPAYYGPTSYGASQYMEPELVSEEGAVIPAVAKAGLTLKDVAIPVALGLGAVTIAYIASRGMRSR